MSISELLFSFQGRINRQPYWLTTIVVIVILMLLVGLAVLLGGGALLFVLIVFYIPLLWIALALGAKRLHDRDKSAWWLIVFYVLPSALSNLSDQAGGGGFLLLLIGAALSIWAFVELGCLRGTIGPNRFGPDPLQTPASASAVAMPHTNTH